MPQTSPAQSARATPRIDGPLPQDHLTLLVELLKPIGPDQARRWLAVLMLVPAEEREQVLQNVRARVLQVYSSETRSVRVAHPPEQRAGYVEQVFTTYDIPGDMPRRADTDGEGTSKGA